MVDPKALEFESQGILTDIHKNFQFRMNFVGNS